LELTGKKIVIIVENLPLPFDRRVWQESNTLKEAGAEVFIICPKGKGYDIDYEVIDGIHIYRYRLPLEAKGALGYFLEYSYSLFYQRKLLNKIWNEHGKFDVIQACNPPDLIYLNVKKYIKKGVKFIFDHHDINPELYIAKFNRKDIFYKLLQYFERQTFRYANLSIATNESYKEIAIKRGLMEPSKVFVVRSGPDLSRLKIQESKLEIKKNKLITIGYIGVIGQQEGIDHLLEILKILLDKYNFNNFHCYIIGDGPVRDNMIKMSYEMKLEDFVSFPGRIPDSEMLDILNSCDICVNPDIYNEMNDKSTMNKIMEYMALGKPIVQYNLTEGRISAGEASLYAKKNNRDDFADKIMELVNNEEKRLLMSKYGKDRVYNDLHWGIEKYKYLDVYKKILAL
tara:strand:+ start:30574 stop:31770 length:1197 start_codon:yes stop_codon:yes gene_type:complete